MSGKYSVYVCKYCELRFWEHEEHDCPKRTEPTYQELVAENKQLKDSLSTALQRIKELEGTATLQDTEVYVEYEIIKKEDG